MKKVKPSIEQLAKMHHGILKAADLIAAGYNYKQIRKLITSGLLEQTGHGMYKMNGFAYDDRLEIAKRIPSGIFCLYTACYLHQLTDFVSSELHMAVPKKSKYVLPAYPPVHLYYWEDHIHQLGIMEYELDKGSIRVYDPEKTVCDVLRLRSKIGIDVVKEVLKNYLLRTDRDLAKLYVYARQLRVEKTINQYLTVLL